MRLTVTTPTGRGVGGPVSAMMLLWLSLWSTLVMAQDPTSLGPSTPTPGSTLGSSGSSSQASPSPTTISVRPPDVSTSPTTTSSDPNPTELDPYGPFGDAFDPDHNTTSSADTVMYTQPVTGTTDVPAAGTLTSSAKSAASTSVATITPDGSVTQNAGLPIPNLKTESIQPRTAINYTMPPSSPLLRFSAGPHNGPPDWNLTYSGVDWVHWMNDSIGLGTGLQTSSVPGAKVTFTFVGSALYISGELEGQLVARAVNNYYPTLPAVETQLDGDGSPGSGNFSIFGSTDMPSEYNITLTLVSGTFSLSGLVVSAPLGGYGARGTSKTVPMLDYSDNISSDVNAIGEWRTINTFCGYTWDSTLDYSVNQCWDGTYPCAASGSQNARLSFNVPANASIFTVYGTMGTSYGPFQIGTQDYIYDDPSLTYTAQSPWSRRAVALYSGTLDPRTANTINIDYLGTPEDYSTIEIYQVVYFLAVGGITEYDYIPMPPPPKGQNLGAIIGGSVGGGVGLLLILAAVWYFWRRRKSRRLAKEKESTLAETETKRLSPDDGPSFFDSTETPDSTYATDLQRTIAGIPPAAHLTTAELVAHKMNEARDASSTTTRQRSDPSTLLSPTSGGTFGPGTFGTDTFGGGTFLSGGGTLIEPQTLPPLKLSLMTGSLAREASSLSPYQQAPLPSPMRTSPLRTSPRLAEPEELLPEHEATVTEEQDAGRVPASETVPPRYNPAWADDYTSNNPNAAQRTHPSEQLPATAVTHSPISPTDSTLRLFNVSEQQVHAADDAGDASDVTPSPNSEVGPSVVQHW